MDIGSRTHRTSPARDEIFVREFSSNSAQGSRDAAGKWLISKGGGTDPRWRGDSKGLFYVASDGKLMSVASAPSQYSRQENPGLFSNCHLVLLAAMSQQTADVF